MPTGCKVRGRATKANFSSDLLREATVAVSSFSAREITLAFEFWLTQLPLLIFDDVRVYPHDLPGFCHERNEAFSVLVLGQWIDDFQSRLGIGNPIMDNHLQESPKIKRHHIGGDFLLSWL